MTEFLKRIPSARNCVRIYGISAQKSMAQNFLYDGRITDKIVNLMQANLKDSLVLEVGPGPGMLTRSLIKAGANNLVLVERDRRFEPILEQLSQCTDGKMQIIWGDALEYRLDMLDTTNVNEIHIVGNLPFNIATPLLFNYLNDISLARTLFNVKKTRTAELLCNAKLTLMFQKEVAHRIVAPAHKSNRGRLSTCVQAICNATMPLELPNTSFEPRPKVDAAIVSLTPKDTWLDSIMFHRLNTVCRIAFHHRQKTMRNNLITQYGMEQSLDILFKNDIDPNIKPADLETYQFIKMSEYIGRMGYLSITEMNPKRRRLDKFE